MSSKLQDTDPMPFGPNRGTAMANVPDSDLKRIWEKYRIQYFQGKTHGSMTQVMTYIADYGPEHLK